VLRIAHLRFQDLPKKGDFSPTSLLKLAVICDKMIDLRKQAITSMLDACYGILDQVLKGPVCKQNPTSETGCRCMILGSYVSFLVAQKLYPVRRQAADISMSLTQ
ncbi:hypothetical protein EJ07DRAFT_41831, partial [Lizonia empirigonia]